MRNVLAASYSSNCVTCLSVSVAMALDIASALFVLV